jgi:general L-amino acid transport system permease protein
MADWAILSATWTGSSRTDCTGDGACWAFVHARLGQFLVGLYPEPERWRAYIALIVVIGALAVLLGTQLRRAIPIGLTIVTSGISAVILLRGGVFGLVPVPTADWGGLLVNLMLATGAALVGLPFAFLIALARRSKWSALHAIATTYVELWRGVPVISVLFMVSIMLPLLVPGGAGVDKLIRALAALSLVTAAFLSEVVRAALDAVPRGQREAAAALGLKPRQILALVVIPAAMRLAVPGLVNELITLGKNTSLVVTVSILDLTGMVQAASNDPKWLGLNLEGYVFTGSVFLVLFASLSATSRRLELRLSRSDGYPVKAHE